MAKISVAGSMVANELTGEAPRLCFERLAGFVIVTSRDRAAGTVLIA